MAWTRCYASRTRRTNRRLRLSRLVRSTSRASRSRGLTMTFGCSEMKKTECDQKPPMPSGRVVAGGSEGLEDRCSFQRAQFTVAGRRQMMATVLSFVVPGSGRSAVGGAKSCERGKRLDKVTSRLTAQRALRVEARRPGNENRDPDVIKARPWSSLSEDPGCGECLSVHAAPQVELQPNQTCKPTPTAPTSLVARDARWP